MTWRTVLTSMWLGVALAVAPVWAQPGGGQDIAGERAAESAAPQEQRESRPERPAWLGVQLAEVPSALAAHLQLKGGLMVANVYRGSPADKAGILQYDVLAEVDGQPVAADIAAFSRYVRDRAPGEQLELLVYRQGEPQTVAIQLESRRRAWTDAELKHEEQWPMPGDEGLRGRIFRRGPEGWILEDLGPLPGAHELPDYLHYYMERVLPDSDKVAECRRVDKDGNVLEVRQSEDDRITVKRYRQTDGSDSGDTQSYASVDELRKADPEACELFESSRGPRGQGIPQKPGVFRQFRWPEWERQYREGLKEFDRHKDRYGEEARRWRDRVEQWRKEGHDLERRWEDWYDRFFQGPLEPMVPDARRDREVAPEQPVPATPGELAETIPEARARFEQNADGSISVHIRHEDAELTRSFSSAEEMKQQAPELYKSYEALDRQIK